MSRQLARQLVRYRWGLVALANGAITWVILIIAPLGLFAVISCTLMVVFASLATGWLGDMALLALLDSVDPTLVQGVRDKISVDAGTDATQRIETAVRRDLPQQGD
jgi:hypothetical protein